MNSFEHDKLIREDERNENKKEFAIKALKKGLDYKLIQELTELPLEEIKALRENLK